jgi:hypothetical protein
MQWLLDVARRAGLRCGENHQMAPNTEAEEAWSAVCGLCDIDEGELAGHVADHFHLPVANFEAAEPKALRLIPETVPVARCADGRLPLM